MITLDVAPLAAWGDMWGQAVDPREWSFWRRRVTQLVGSSTAPDVVAAVRAAAANASRVLVVLDSDHSYDHVRAEMAALCGLATVGSYCVVEDTKMGAPGRAAAEFVAASGGAWENDAAREYLLFTQHRGGWLKRKR